MQFRYNMSPPLNHHRGNRTLFYFYYPQSVPNVISYACLDHHMSQYPPPSLQHPSKPICRQYMVFLLVQPPPKIGPSLLVSSNYYIWTRLPQILSLFGPSMAELCRNPAKNRVRRFPVMSRFPVMYGSAICLGFTSLPLATQRRGLCPFIGRLSSKRYTGWFVTPLRNNYLAGEWYNRHSSSLSVVLGKYAPYVRLWYFLRDRR